MAYINRENAKELARLGNIKRWQTPKEEPQSLNESHNGAAVNKASTAAIRIDDYRLKRLMRVRKQLDRVDAMMMQESDPAKLDRLASAQTRLSEQERVLDGRPTPGQLKPATPRNPRTQTSAPTFHIPEPPAQQ